MRQFSKIKQSVLLLMLSQSCYSMDVVYVGDSIAAMMKKNNPYGNVVKYRKKDDETAVGGKDPKWIYERLHQTLSRYPNYLNGRIVVLSSGYSNDPEGKYIDYHEKIIRTLLMAGAHEIRMLGMAKNYHIKNKWGEHFYDKKRYGYLKYLAQKYGVYIYPEFYSFDHVHMSLKDMKLINYGLN